jgi:pimeloyl-ACP methyl ester carboxylesterase
MSRLPFISFKDCIHLCIINQYTRQPKSTEMKTGNLTKTAGHLLFMIIAMTTVCVAQPATNTRSTLKSSGYAPVNGINVYYEVHGEGRPIVLLHGSYMTINLNWSQLIPELAKTRKVIAVEMQGHGHTAYSERAMTFPVLAADVAGVMKYLKIDSADIVGYSFGGTVAYQLTIQNPELVKKLVIISSTYKIDGWQPEVRNIFNIVRPEFFDATPLRAEYVKVAPDTSYWHKFVAKMIELDKTPFDLGDDNIKKIKVPVLIICGDNDGIDKTILINTYKLLGGAVSADMVGVPKSQLAIIAGKGHVSLMMDSGAILANLNSFLK